MRRRSHWVILHRAGPGVAGTEARNAARTLDMQTLEAQRRRYAELVVRSAGSTDGRLIAAFAAVAREQHLGPSPWLILAGPRLAPTITDDPQLLYQDVLVALARDRGINNGQPSLHARSLAAAALAPGETVVHVGAGTGYYSAILAQLVGSGGHVLAFEIEPDLAERARVNLRARPNVEVRAGSALGAPLRPCDLIYVSAGASHLPAAWLDALKLGGRLVLPLTPDAGYGCMLMVTRRNADVYAATALMRVSFIPCIGARDDATSMSLSSALERDSLSAVRSLHRTDAPDRSAWCVGRDWWLSTAPPAA